MGETSIEWTNATWNPTRGCSIASPGCKNCYAMKIAHRFSGPGGKYEALTRLRKKLGPIWTGEMRAPEEMLDAPLHWKKPRRVFVNSMSDLFHENLRDEDIEAVFGVMHAASQHTYQVLTKRADRMRDFMKKTTAEACLAELTLRNVALNSPKGRRDRFEHIEEGWPWPPPNVWLGVSVEDQRRADERIPALLETPAAVRFLSCEPLLGPVDLTPFLHLRPCPQHPGERTAGWGHLDCDCSEPRRNPALRTLDWVIVGGESGHRARPCAENWIESIVRQCRRANVPVFVKQLGAFVVDEGRSLTREEQIAFGRDPNNPLSKWAWRAGLNHPKGGDPEEWPDELRVREWPEAGS